jgi:hypothetical protein
MQQPTIGRIVHVSTGGLRTAATVIFVHNPTCVNVIVHSVGGEVRSSLTYEEETPESAAKINHTDLVSTSWTWPPRI